MAAIPSMRRLGEPRETQADGNVAEALVAWFEHGLHPGSLGEAIVLDLPLEECLLRSHMLVGNVEHVLTLKFFVDRYARKNVRFRARLINARKKGVIAWD